MLFRCGLGLKRLPFTQARTGQEARLDLPTTKTTCPLLFCILISSSIDHGTQVNIYVLYFKCPDRYERKRIQLELSFNTNKDPDDDRNYLSLSTPPTSLNSFYSIYLRATICCHYRCVPLIRQTYSRAL